MDRRGPDAHQPSYRAAQNLANIHIHAILDAVALPLIVIGRHGIILLANQAARSAFPALQDGYPLSSVIRSPDCLHAVQAVLAGQLEADALLIEHVPVERSFILRAHRLFPQSNGVLIASKEAIAILQLSETTQIRRTETMRVDFIANASHELRTPLASILGFIETLQGPAREDVKARAHFLAIMNTQARRMARLIDDLLSLSKIELSEHIRPTDPVNLQALLVQLVDALSGLARERNVTIRLNLPETTPDMLPGNRDELLRVFENLIENAIKYGASGMFVDVSLRVIENGTMQRVDIRDYGPGIAAKHLPRLTERFYRADLHESRIQGGTGLGLAIAKHSVTRHRGQLHITSEPGAGATFTIMLPSTQRQQSPQTEHTPA